MVGKELLAAWFDVAVRVAAAVSLLAILFIGIRQSEAQHCFQRYADRAAASTLARSAAAAADRAAEDQLYAKIATDPGHSVQALNAYLATRRETDRQRAENPPAAPPSSTCG